MSTGARPPFLYRFRSLANEEDRARVRDIVRNDRVWLSSPTRFNDPFECRPHLSFGTNREDQKAFAKKVAREARHDLPRREQRKMAEQIYKGMVQGAAPGFDRVAAYFKDFAVLSLSEDPTNIVTWGHYADGHRGIALGFDFAPSSKPNIFMLAVKVKYQKDYPQCDVTAEDSDAAFIAALATKALGWAYEGEWRLIARKLSETERRANFNRDIPVDEALIYELERGEGYYPFPAPILSRIVLGAQISSENRKFILSLAQERKAPLTVIESRLNPSSFGVDLNLVS